MTFLCLNCFYVYVTWKRSSSRCGGGESQSGSEIEGVGCKNYVSLGIILMTDIHKYLCTDNKSFGCTELRGSSEREWNSSLLVSILSRVLSKLFLGAKAIMTFHIFPLPSAHPPRGEKAKALPKITVRKVGAGCELCIRIHVYRMYILFVKGKNGEDVFPLFSFFTISLPLTPQQHHEGYFCSDGILRSLPSPSACVGGVRSESRVDFEAQIFLRFLRSVYIQIFMCLILKRKAREDVYIWLYTCSVHLCVKTKIC